MDDYTRCDSRQFDGRFLRFCRNLNSYLGSRIKCSNAASFAVANAIIVDGGRAV
jgi:hypothetical protein